MAISKAELISILADALAIDPDEIKDTSTFEELGGMDSVSRLSMISLLESQVGPEAIFDELRTVKDVPSLLNVMRARGLVE